MQKESLSYLPGEKKKKKKTQKKNLNPPHPNNKTIPSLTAMAMAMPCMPHSAKRNLSLSLPLRARKSIYLSIHLSIYLEPLIISIIIIILIQARHQQITTLATALQHNTLSRILLDPPTRMYVSAYRYGEGEWGRGRGRGRGRGKGKGEGLYNGALQHTRVEVAKDVLGRAGLNGMLSWV